MWGISKERGGERVTLLCLFLGILSLIDENVDYGLVWTFRKVSQVKVKSSKDDLKLSLYAWPRQWIPDPVLGEMKFRSFLAREGLWWLLLSALVPPNKISQGHLEFASGLIPSTTRAKIVKWYCRNSWPDSGMWRSQPNTMTPFPWRWSQTRHDSFVSVSLASFGLVS